MAKGGGCENTNVQYAVPVELPHLGRADRTLEGVRKCILHAVWQAQGKGCSPGAIGVAIGGDPQNDPELTPRVKSRISCVMFTNRSTWRIISSASFEASSFPDFFFITWA